MYGNLILFPELRHAHHENDKAVMEAYGFSPRMAEPVIVEELVKRLVGFDSTKFTAGHFLNVSYMYEPPPKRAIVTA